MHRYNTGITINQKLRAKSCNCEGVYSEEQAIPSAIRIYMIEYPKEQTDSLYLIPTNVTVRKQLLKGKIRQNAIL